MPFTAAFQHNANRLLDKPASLGRTTPHALVHMRPLATATIQQSRNGHLRLRLCSEAQQTAERDDRIEIAVSLDNGGEMPFVD